MHRRRAPTPPDRTNRQVWGLYVRLSKSFKEKQRRAHPNDWPEESDWSDTADESDRLDLAPGAWDRRGTCPSGQVASLSNEVADLGFLEGRAVDADVVQPSGEEGRIGLVFPPPDA